MKFFYPSLEEIFLEEIFLQTHAHEIDPRNVPQKCSEQEEEHHLKLAADNGTWVLLTNVAFTQFMPGGVSSRFSSSS